MLQSFDHMAIIISKEANLDFYKKLGFEEFFRKDRPEKGDVLLMMKNGDMVLEFFIRPDAPLRHCQPEAYGCRHIAFDVDDVENVLEALKGYSHKPIVTKEDGNRLVFVTDADGQPVEFIERCIS